MGTVVEEGVIDALIFGPEGMGASDVASDHGLANTMYMRARLASPVLAVPL
jgi:hypothetical protein